MQTKILKDRPTLGGGAKKKKIIFGGGAIAPLAPVWLRACTYLRYLYCIFTNLPKIGT